ncbi:helix-turn-helix domain-containing protein [uncultured Agrobacterium sp.]|uniref:helix-turn-helix domain-containing protein n=1 Tax=uncultured Agrobacterium sp. TaxID=157277 RepID=UPI0025EA1020|nr:helix-turn-helix domain-containing protein [uncultured Agrobacterium sp.]
MATNPTKISRLRQHFLSGRSLTQLEAIGLYGAFRLAARVHQLKAEGFKFDTVMKADPMGNPYAEYRLRMRRVR